MEQPDPLPNYKFSEETREELRQRFPVLTSEDIDALNEITYKAAIRKSIETVHKKGDPNDGETGEDLRAVQKAAEVFLDEVRQAAERFEEVHKAKLEKRRTGVLLLKAYVDGCENQGTPYEDSFGRFGKYSKDILHNVAAMVGGINSNPYMQELMRKEGARRRKGSGDYSKMDIVTETAKIFRERLKTSPERWELRAALRIMGCGNMDYYIRNSGETKDLMPRPRPGRRKKA
jgi:hypothetical protein